MATADTNREGTFGRQLMTYISSRLPYSQPYSVIDDINQINPKYKDFYDTGTKRQELLTKHSISTHHDGSNDGHPMASVAIDKNYHAFMYANVDFDKSKRLRDYRVMAQFAEVADALDEICDECINKDAHGNIVIFNIEKKDTNLNIREELNKEFSKFMNHYELELKGWEWFRQLLVDGELYFEHVIHQKHKDAGILGVMNIPSELMDPIYDNVQNLLVRGFLLRKPVIEKKSPQSSSLNPTNKVEQIPFDKNQITYIHSGIWNESKTLRMPFIENARRAYRQLSLIEDAIIIYRLVRAPERLIFNVDVGNMAPPKAEAYLKKLMQNYWSRKTYDSSQGKSVQAFNPQSMLDNFWFAKRTGSEGTTVNQLQGGANLGELTDLMYFKQKLYRSLKVPVGRLNAESVNDVQGVTILREELKFARFIIRLQQHFASGLRNAFITHLKLKNLWDEYDLKESDFVLTFNPPTNFHELRNQQINDLKFNNYGNMVNNPLISDTFAKANYLGLSDKEIQENRELLRKDAALEWELAQITAMGPNWREQFEEAEDAAEAAAGMPLGGMPMGGGGMPPTFGPSPGGESLPEGQPPPEQGTGPITSPGTGPETALP